MTPNFYDTGTVNRQAVWCTGKEMVELVDGWSGALADGWSGGLLDGWPGGLANGCSHSSYYSCYCHF